MTPFLRRGTTAAALLLRLPAVLFTAGLACVAAAAAAESAGPATRATEQPPRPLSARDREPRLAELRLGLEKTLSTWVRKNEGPKSEPSVRDLGNAALAGLLLGNEPAEAERLVEREFDLQDLDEKSPAFGMLPWQVGHPEIHDDNAIEFGTQPVGPMLIAFGDRLSPRFKQNLTPHLKASFAAMNRRNFKTPSYTNIFLMRAVSMILLGEAIADDKAADEGYRQLDDWIAFTRRCGIHEFDSPTYYCTDLNSLNLGYLYAARPGAREKFKAILDCFWADVAANYFVANGCLSGPHSRNYDFLHSWGGLDLYLYAEGFCGDSHVPHPDLEKVYLLLAGDPKAYHPPQSLYALASEPRRVVLSRWDPSPDRTRYNYVTPEFAIGSASGGDYGQQDKLITVELASAKKLPVISVIPDASDAPWGKEKTLDRSGHPKPTHLPMRPVTVQEEGAILALLDVDAAAMPAGARSLATDVLLPAAADAIALDDRRVPAGEPFEQPAPFGSVVGVREGDAAVAIRVFQADGLAGQKAEAVLSADPAGLKEGAARLAVYHFRGAAGPDTRPTAATHVRVGLLIVAERCAGDADFNALLRRVRQAKVESAEDGGVWRATATVGPVVLEAARDLPHRKIVSRTVNGSQVKSDVLSVNGRDVAAEAWRALPAAAPAGAGGG